MDPSQNNTSLSIEDEDTRYTRGFGVCLILISIPGLYFNIAVLSQFLHTPKTSFSIMCLSKTVSNSFVLLVHMLYNGPCGVLYMALINDMVNSYLTQAVTYGIYLLGPLTQTLISINRFLVVYTSPTRIPTYSNKATIGILSIFWLIGIYMSTFIGFPTDCRMKLVLPLHWPWIECESDFIMNLVADFLYYVLALAVFSNFVNLLVIFKLVASAQNVKTLSSESSRRRRQTTIRLFAQSCIQDGIYVMDMFNSLYFANFAYEDVTLFVTTLGASLMIHVADGFVMFMFHRRRTTWKKPIIISVT